MHLADNKLQRTVRPDRAVKFAGPGARDNQQDFEERKNRRNREDRVPAGGSENRFDTGRYGLPRATIILLFVIPSSHIAGAPLHRTLSRASGRDR